MAETLTDVDQFDATIQMPTASELASAADLRDKAIQRLANRTRNSKNRLDSHDTSIAGLTVAKVGHFYFTASSSAAAATMPIQTKLLYPGGTWTLSSNQVTVPSAGVYRVNYRAMVALDTGASPAQGIIYARVGSTNLIRGYGERFNGTNSSNFSVAGHGLIPITDPATQKIFFTNGSIAALEPESYASDPSGDTDVTHPIVIEYLGTIS